MAVKLFRKRLSKDWPVIAATVTGASFERRLAEVRYEYWVVGELFQGKRTEPFLSGFLGEDYVKRFPSGYDYPIRVKPGKPSTSIAVRG